MNDVVGPMSERGREMGGGNKRFIHPPFHLSCFGDSKVKKHIAVMTEINCDGIPIR